MYLSGNILDIGVPPVVKILIAAVNKIMNIRGFKPLKVYFMGTPDTSTAISVNITMAVNSQKELMRNTITINVMVNIIFVLGSAL
jgi:hypothetical protein